MKPLIISVSWQDPDVWSMAVSFDLLMYSVSIQWTRARGLPPSPPGTMWPQIKIIKQETSLVLPCVQASSTEASWDYPVDLEWPKHPIIMPCQNKQLLSHHFLKPITQNMQQFASFSPLVWVLDGWSDTPFQQEHSSSVMRFSYGDFGECVLPAGCFYSVADFAHASLIDIWSTHML